MQLTQSIVKQFFPIIFFGGLTANFSFAQCEVVDTTTSSYEQRIEHWLGTLGQSPITAIAEMDTLLCLAQKLEKWEDGISIFYGTEYTFHDKNLFSQSLELEKQFEKIYSIFGSQLDVETKHFYYVLHLVAKMNLYNKLGTYDLSTEIAKETLSFLDTATISQNFKKARLANIYNYLGNNAYNRGHFEEALGFYDQSIEHTTKKQNKWANKLKADILVTLGRHKEAIFLYKEVLVSNQFLLKENKFSDAADFSRVVDRLVELNIKLSAVFQKNLDSTSTFKHLNQAISLHHSFQSTRYWNILDQYGLSLIEFNQPHQAIDSLEKSLILKKQTYASNHPGISDTYFRLGQAHQKKKDWQASLTSFNSACNSLLDKPLSTNKEFSLPTNDQIENTLFKIKLAKILWGRSTILEKTHDEKTGNQNKQQIFDAQQTIQLAIFALEKARLSFYEESDKQFLQHTHYPIFEAAIRINEQLYQQTGIEKYRWSAFDNGS